LGTNRAVRPRAPHAAHAAALQGGIVDGLRAAVGDGPVAVPPREEVLGRTVATPQ